MHERTRYQKHIKNYVKFDPEIDEKSMQNLCSKKWCQTEVKKSFKIEPKWSQNAEKYKQCTRFIKASIFGDARGVGLASPCWSCLRKGSARGLEWRVLSTRVSSGWLQVLWQLWVPKGRISIKRNQNGFEKVPNATKMDPKRYQNEPKGDQRTIKIALEQKQIERSHEKGPGPTQRGRTVSIVFFGS